MAVYNGRLRITGNGDRYDYRFSPLPKLIPSNNKNSLFTRHKIVNIQVLTKFCTIIVGFYDILGITQISSGSYSHSRTIVITLNYISAYLSSIDCFQFNTFDCFITHEVAKVSFSCFYRSSPIINKFFLLKMTFFLSDDCVIQIT